MKHRPAGAWSSAQAMAWPTKRKRSTGSRREARGQLLGVVASVAAVAIGLLLLSLSRFAPERLSGLRTGALELSAPIWGAARGPARAIMASAADIGDYWDAVGHARRLETELAAAQRESARAALFEAENRRLKHLLRFAEADRRRVAVARVAGGSGASLVETAIVSAGAAAGVRPGQPVTTDAGLLGRVTEVAAHASRVLLVSDNESRVPVRVLRTGAPAVLAGVGGGMAELRFVGAGPDAAPRAGDLIVTSGEGGLFAPDIPVARVTSITGETAHARPLARADTLGFAVIEAAWMPTTAPRDVAVTGVPPPHPVRMAAMIDP